MENIKEFTKLMERYETITLPEIEAIFAKWKALKTKDTWIKKCKPWYAMTIIRNQATDTRHMRPGCGISPKVNIENIHDWPLCDWCVYNPTEKREIFKSAEEINKGGFHCMKINKNEKEGTMENYNQETSESFLQNCRKIANKMKNVLLSKTK